MMILIIHIAVHYVIQDLHRLIKTGVYVIHSVINLGKENNPFIQSRLNAPFTLKAEDSFIGIIWSIAAFF